MTQPCPWLGTSLTSKPKRHKFGCLLDAYGQAFPAEARPPTYIAASLIPKFVGTGQAGEQAGLTVELVAVAWAMVPFSTQHTIPFFKQCFLSSNANQWCRITEVTAPPMAVLKRSRRCVRSTRCSRTELPA